MRANKKIILAILLSGFSLSFYLSPVYAATKKFYLHSDHDGGNPIANTGKLGEAIPHVATNAYGAAPELAVGGVSGDVMRYKPKGDSDAGFTSETDTETDYNINGCCSADNEFTGNLAPKDFPRNGLGWWSTTTYSGIFEKGEWGFNQRSGDNRSSINSDDQMRLWAIPQNTATTGARLISFLDETGDTWDGGQTTAKNIIASSTSPYSATTTLSAEYLYLEVFDEEVSNQNAGKIITMHIEGSTLADNLRTKITSSHFQPSVIQEAYRWFSNADSADVGAALAAQDTAATAPAQGTPFRLRMALHATTSALLNTGTSTSFNLEFAPVSGTCDTSFTGETYAGVSASSGDIRFYNNSPADGATATANANDPTGSGHTKIMQRYEEANATTPVATVSNGQDGVWDFSLVDFSAPASSTYCFRMARNEDNIGLGFGKATTTFYAVIPEITTAAAGAVAVNKISGTIYTDEGTTQLASAGKVLNIRVGTSTPGIFSTTTIAATGAWEMTVDETGIVAGTPITVWADNDSTFRASAFTIASTTSNDISGLNLYQNRVIVRHEGTSATSTTNKDLGIYDRDNDPDIQFQANNNNLIVNSGQALYVMPGTEFAPGGTVTLDGNASTGSIEGSLKLPTGTGQNNNSTSTILSLGANTLTLGGSFFASSTSIINYGTGSGVLFSATTTGKNIFVPGINANFASTTFNGVGGGWTFQTPATTTGNFGISAGTVTAPSGTLYIGGNYLNSGTFTNNSGTVISNGTANQIFSGTMIGSSAFSNLQVTNNTANATTTFSNSASTTATFTVTASSARLEFPAGATSTFQNLTITGTSGSEIYLHSKTPGTQWNIHVPGTRSVTYANIKDSDACTASGNIDVSDGTSINKGNNDCWNFPAAITLSGTLYSDEGTTLITSGKTIKASVNGGAVGGQSGTTNGSGVYSITLDATPAAGNPITVWVDGDSATFASVLTKASSTNSISGLNLYQNRVIVRHEAFTATSTTNADLSIYDGDTSDGSGDTDIQFITSTTSPKHLHVKAGNMLYVWPGTEYKPGGSVQIHGNAQSAPEDGSFKLAYGTGPAGVATSSILTLDNSMTLAGSWFASSSAKLNFGTTTSNANYVNYTVDFNATTTGKTIFATTTDFYNVEFTGVGGAWSFAGNSATSTKDFRIGAVGNAWTQTGDGLGISSITFPVVASLNGTDVAFIDNTNDTFRTYRFTKTATTSTWSQVGNGLTITGIIDPPAVTALNGTDIAYIDETNDSLRTYRFDGTNWSQVGSGLAVAAVTNPALAALNGTDVAFIDATNESLRTYRFDGTNWSQVGSGLAVANNANPALAALNGTDVAFIDGTNESLRTYRWDGSVWSQVGNGLGIANITGTTIAALNETDIAYIDETNDSLRTYRFDGTNWSQVGSGLAVAAVTNPALAALNGTDVAFIDDTNKQLRTYTVRDLNSPTVTAPSTELSIGGNYANKGVFTNNSGTININGTTTQMISGFATGTSAFYNLTVKNDAKSGNGRATTTIANAASTTATFTVAASNARIEFPQYATTTLQNISITGTSGNEIYFHPFATSSTSTVQWNIHVPGTRSVTYANIKDSDACTASGNIDVSDGTSINKGNNDCWDFTAGVAGTLVVSNNDGGIELSKFDESLDPTDQTVTNAELFSFKLTPTSETVTASPIVISLTNIQSMNCGDFSTLELYYDVAGDGDTSGDSAVGAVACSISGNEGTMSITGAFAASTARNFILRAGTFSNNNPGNSIRFSLLPSNITATAPVAGSITATGFVTEVNQFRSNISGNQSGGGGTPTQTSTVEVPTGGGGPGGGEGSGSPPTPTETPTGGGGQGGGEGTWIPFERFFASAISGLGQFFAWVW